MLRKDLDLDVTEAAGLGERAAVAVTVDLPAPERLGPAPVVCFAKAGSGLSRGYFTVDLPGPAAGPGSQAGWHADRGWVVVSVDHLGTGGSSRHDRARTGYAPLAAAADAAEREVLRRLRAGELDPGFPPLPDPAAVGIGQSMGGCMTVVQQARHRTYDGIAVLGYSPLHVRVAAPGRPPLVNRWLLRDDPAVAVNLPAFETAGLPADPTAALADAFFADDVDLAAVRWGDRTAPWLSAARPAVAATCATPGAIASEAAGVDVPVLVAVGDRDVVADPRGEARAYLSAAAVDLFVCPRMGHLHNFAGSRETLWRRIAAWGDWVAAERGAHPASCQ